VIAYSRKSDMVHFWGDGIAHSRYLVNLQHIKAWKVHV